MRGWAGAVVSLRSGSMVGERGEGKARKAGRWVGGMAEIGLWRGTVWLRRLGVWRVTP